ncbi:MAG: energy-coupling factor transporter transmembrane protein EcfT [Spirochaetales bacterium]|nr:energy-coupling factor transporter transmembrane protein EcfT [Spirochaetales bacterium]
MIGSAYRDTGSLLHAFDPRVKLLIVLGWSVLLFLPMPQPQFRLPLYSVTVFLLTAGFLGIRDAWTPIRSILPLLILVLLLTPPFYRDGTPVLLIGERVIVTSGGIEETVRLISRFTGITMLFFLFFRTTSLQHVILTLRSYGLSYRIALVITLALRYIPYIAQLFKTVRSAHALRDPMTEPEEVRKGWGLRRKGLELFPVLMSVIIASVKTIPNLAAGLEFRGFGREEQRTSYRRLPRDIRTLRDGLIGLIVLSGIYSPIILHMKLF